MTIFVDLNRELFVIKDINLYKKGSAIMKSLSIRSGQIEGFTFGFLIYKLVLFKFFNFFETQLSHLENRDNILTQQHLTKFLMHNRCSKVVIIVIMLLLLLLSVC